MNNKEPVRVLHVVRKMDLGGAESMIMNLYRHIDKEAVQFDFLTHDKSAGSFDEEIKKLGGRIFTINAMNGFNAIPYYKECSKFFKKHKEISIVHGHIGSCSALYLKAAKNAGKFTVVHSHSVGIIKSMRNVAFKIYSFPTRFIADAFFGCSTEAGESRFGKALVKSDKYQNFPNAIDIEGFAYDENTREEVRSEFGFKNDDIVIGTIGRIVEAKNPDYILDIFEKASKSQEQVYCIWVGYGEKENVLRRRIIEAELESKIIMTGRRNDASRILQALDCFIMPSIYEGLPVSAIEAQTSGLPCLLSDRITQEVQVSELVSWENISKAPSVWANTALKIAEDNKGIRKSPIEEIREHGYDIKEASKKLMNFYLINANK